MTRLIETLQELIPSRDCTSAAGWIPLYFRDLPEEDTAVRTPDSWLCQFLLHLRLAQSLPEAGKAYRITICNPELSEHGWQSRHTVVDLVINDMPFLVDTISMAIARQGLKIHLIIHPVMRGIRSESGELCVDLGGTRHEAWMHFEIDRITGPRLDELEAEIDAALQALLAAVADWPAMVRRVGEEREWLSRQPAASAHGEAAEFLDWLLAGNFVFLGCRDYLLKDGQLDIVPDSNLGIIRNTRGNGTSRVWQHLPAALRAQAYAAERPVQLTKSERRSIIHRPAYLDLVMLRRFDAAGELESELRLFGLYSASAYNTPSRQIPLIRQKIDQVLQLCSADLSGHRGKALLNILDTYPRDELIEIDPESLARIASGILGLNERQRVRAFFRDDLYGRYTSVMLFVPRDNYNSDLREKIIELLRTQLSGSRVEFTVTMNDSPLARIHFLVHRNPDAPPPLTDNATLEARIAVMARRWQDGLLEALLAMHGEETGNTLFQRYQHAFSAAYCAEHQPEVAVHDIDHIELARSAGTLQLALHPAGPLDRRNWRIKLYHTHSVTLSDCLPLLENLGLHVIDERPHPVMIGSVSPAWVIDIGIELPDGCSLEKTPDRQRLLEGFAATFAGQNENDSFNRLLLFAGLEWQDVRLLRAYCRFLKQVGLKHASEHLAETLIRLQSMTRQLALLFHLRHDPDNPQDAVADLLAEEIAQGSVALPNADDERVISSLLSAIEATVRSNFYQLTPAGTPKAYLSFKLESARVLGMPQPVPLFEIFVYAADFEGVHLRGGKVARGGLRWSDRREDFRTEVLGLVKAQMVKNTVIVPVGSKGGFVLKNPPVQREAWLECGQRCYQNFIRGLLDLTDNRKNGEIIPPARLRRRDADDPYLVVAADKGTASFSDLANSVSQEYGFWLDDAFASGGSAGYDHKKMGITARGAWVSVERHFLELGIAPLKDAFTVVGIGDMSGDVFGNGMLLSPRICLLAAFDHRHIFLDPAPDPVVSLAERQRLFLLPRSSWEDYDPSLISKGGGVYSRTLKKIKISSEIREALCIDADELEPNALIQQLLKAPVDLLYNGGIGTYVKASTQSHAEVNDRSNDVLRVDGRELRCRCVSEGGNLGFTQSGRIEYALNGGRIHTDAIDNSAGVDCSDHEVNIKILLGGIVADGDLTIKQRNTLLASMTDAVAAQVLADNAGQTLALALEAAQGVSLLPVHQRFMQALEASGKLSRRLEYLPSDSVIQSRLEADQALTRPELAVLLAYAKIVLSQSLLASALPDEPQFAGTLLAYFPQALVEHYSNRIARHPLRREIITTAITNRIVNQYGLTCVFRLTEETESGADKVVDALLRAEALLAGGERIRQLEGAAARLGANEQIRQLLAVRQHTERLARWLLQHPQPGERQLSLWPVLLGRIAPTEADSAEYCSGLEHALGMMELLLRLPEHLDDQELQLLCQSYLGLYRTLELDWLSSVIESLPRSNRWQTLARLAARDELHRIHAELTLAAASSGCEAWLDQHGDDRTRIGRLFAELRTAPCDLAMITAALRELRARLLS
ncbi:NAD-glutamate dehydrogenase [Chitinilyticum piscinae]|uniref:NAD-glutamate dehydrogenase n=1 Tax=Chitinilyticum piscinae TaxID=2866724 RepID=A0A8J7K8G6_9NEIS|nr:NAD-glutamate dehydrogenase [Chitinilyticum piscinae]MBE9609478.1 NAD-glutamate dehydrogenase [Chitinilyticum piscinae]